MRLELRDGIQACVSSMPKLSVKPIAIVVASASDRSDVGDGGKKSYQEKTERDESIKIDDHVSAAVSREEIDCGRKKLGTDEACFWWKL